ncbi:MAG: selenocysteine-specific elongation factor [Verrucomicrobiales bacterium]|jgi:selenocysteine-specific elongation factor
MNTARWVRLRLIHCFFLLNSSRSVSRYTMKVRHFIVGTAGHIDHGKSSLVKALTGIDPDRLPEEKARGMTIDLGFAHLRIEDPDDSELVYDIGIVDVPGHADFVKNMVAGVGSIDLALFIVAADDGWMPQSEEHLQILSYLGVDHALMAMTKSDLADDLEFTVEMVRDDISGSAFEGIEIVPTSAIKGTGIDELKTALARKLRDVPDPTGIGKPRLPVDRVFSPQGIGTVVTGTLIGGEFSKGEAAVVQPGGLETHLRNIQSHSSDQDAAQPGMRTALNLSDVSIASRERRDGIHRGDVVTLPGLGEPCDTLDVLLEKGDREVRGQPSAIQPIKNGQKVRWHHGGANYGARVIFLSTKILERGQQVIAQLRFEEPVYAFVGDRFVLRDWGKRSTIAGGIILDSDARRRIFRQIRQKEFLEKRAAAPDDIATYAATLIERDKAVPLSGFLAKSRFSRDQINAALKELTDADVVATQGKLIVDQVWWKRMFEKASTLIRDHHAAHPEHMGLLINNLRPKLTSSLPDPKLFDPLLDALCQNGFVRAGKSVRWSDHSPQLPANLAAAGDRIRAALKANPLEPPNPKELAPTDVDSKALKFLLETGEAIQLSDKAVILSEVFESAKARIVGYIRNNGASTASDLRQAVDTTRRILIPLLERLDSEGTTRRDGELRVLRS